VTRPDAHTRYAELAAGHALNALEPEDEQEFLAHLEACELCEHDVVEHRTALAHLAYAPDAAEPPAALLEGIRAGVIASGRPVSWPSEPEPPPTSLSADRDRRADRTRMRRAGALTGIAAAAALIVSLGAWNVSLQNDRDQQLALGDRLSAAVRELGRAETVPLTGTDGVVVAVALLYDDEMSLLVDGLEVNDAGTTYVLWGKSRSGDIRPVAAFDVTGEMFDLRERLQLADGVADVRTLMVTREPGRLAPPLPTQPVLASGTV